MSPETAAGRRMLNIPAIRNSYSTAAWIEEIRGVEQEAAAKVRAELRAKVETMRLEPRTFGARSFNRGLVAVLDLLRDDPG